MGFGGSWRRPALAARAVCLLVSGVVACSVYDDSLLLPADGGGGSGATATGGQGGSGNAPSCNVAADCPGEDTACQSRTCDGGVCGALNVAIDTVLGEQMTGDCVVLACDGAGDVKGTPDDDPFVDGNECTVDACQGDTPTNDPSPSGTPCSAGVCDGAGACVECVGPSECGGDICQNNVCVPATCVDGMQNGTETDEDCGGDCNPCSTGRGCGDGGDCVGGVCSGGTCAPTCTDGEQNQGETDLDCGGSCAPCDMGQGCNVAGDCVAGSCPSGVCVCSGDHLMISEVRSRGETGGNDEFIELYNPTASAVVLDATWTIEARGSGAGSYGVRWTGGGGTITPFGHYLVVRSVANGYDEQPAGDDTLSAGVTDAASIRLVQAGATIDVLCYAHSPSTLAAVQGAGFECEGEPADNSPHNDSTAGMSNTNVSLERRPGGALGNCVDTGDSAADFVATSPALPQSTASAPTP